MALYQNSVLFRDALIWLDQITGTSRIIDKLRLIM
jgi:hypothetical protein